jgi:hypothetical protein
MCHILAIHSKKPQVGWPAAWPVAQHDSPIVHVADFLSSVEEKTFITISARYTACRRGSRLAWSASFPAARFDRFGHEVCHVVDSTRVVFARCCFLFLRPLRTARTGAQRGSGDAGISCAARAKRDCRKDTCRNQDPGKTSGRHFGGRNRCPAQCRLLWTSHRISSKNFIGPISAGHSFRLGAVEERIRFSQSLFKRVVLPRGRRVGSVSAVWTAAA